MFIDSTVANSSVWPFDMFFSNFLKVRVCVLQLDENDGGRKSDRVKDGVDLVYSGRYGREESHQLGTES